jgi:hypothetical protein
VRATRPARPRAYVGARRRRSAARPLRRRSSGCAATADQGVGGLPGHCVGGCLAPTPGQLAARSGARRRRTARRRTIEPGATALDNVRPPRLVNEPARREPRQPPALIAGELPDEPYRGQELIVVAADAAELDVDDQGLEELAAGGAAVGDQEVEMPRISGTSDASGPVEIRADGMSRLSNLRSGHADAHCCVALPRDESGSHAARPALATTRRPRPSTADFCFDLSASSDAASARTQIVLGVRAEQAALGE